MKRQKLSDRGRLTPASSGEDDPVRKSHFYFVSRHKSFIKGGGYRALSYSESNGKSFFFFFNFG